MKIVVVSDSHRNNQVLTEILKREKDADLFLHAGDMEEEPRLLFPYICVKGNCDYFNVDTERIIPLGKHKLYISHGHLFSLTRNNILRIAKEKGCDIFIHGHTHKYYYEEIDEIHIMCPGSVTYPRDKSKSYLVLLINNDQVEVIKKEL